MLSLGCQIPMLAHLHVYLCEHTDHMHVSSTLKFTPSLVKHSKAFSVVHPHVWIPSSYLCPLGSSVDIYLHQNRSPLGALPL